MLDRYLFYIDIRKRYEALLNLKQDMKQLFILKKHKASVTFLSSKIGKQMGVKRNSLFASIYDVNRD